MCRCPSAGVFFPLVFVLYFLKGWTDSLIHAYEVKLGLDKSALSLWLAEFFFFLSGLSFGILTADGMKPKHHSWYGWNSDKMNDWWNNRYHNL